MFEDLIKEYKCLKIEAEFAVRFANMLQSLTYVLNKNNNKNDVNYYIRRSKELLEEYYSREVFK